MLRALLSSLIIMVASISVLRAHQPRIAGDDLMIEVTDTDISKAYYGTLSGQSVTYVLDKTDDGELYISLTVPDVADAETDWRLDLYSDEAQEELITSLVGTAHSWTSFYEAFAGDDYLSGPEWEQVLASGTYYAVVSSPDDQGDYVFVVGRKEYFPPAEILNTYQVLPQIKQTYFDKSPLSAFWNQTTLFLAIALLVGGLIIALLVWLGRWLWSKKS